MVGIAVTIATAFILRSYVALIFGIMTTRILKVAFGYRMHPYRPRLTLHSWRSLIGYSVWTWALTVLEMLRDRSDSIFIGRLLNPAKVGIYAIGYEVAALSSTELVEPLSRAAFSGFAEARHTGISVGENFLRIISTAFLVTLPAGIGIALVADPLVRIAFGPQWVEAIPVVRMLGVAFSVSVFGVLGFHLLSAHALLGSIFRIMLAGAVIRVAMLAVLVPPFGLIGAAAAAAASTLMEQAIYIIVTFRTFHVRIRDLLGHVWRSLLATAAMVGVLATTGLAFSPSLYLVLRPGVHLLIAGIVGSFTYAAIILLSWRASGRPPGAEADMLTLLRSSLSRAARAF